MAALDWRSPALHEDVLRDPASDSTRLVVWLPRGLRDGFRHWERVASVPESGVMIERGICASAATSSAARQAVGDRAEASGLPDPALAQPCGEAESDVVLAWPEDRSLPIDEARLRALWPGSRRVVRLGVDLFVVAGVRPPGARRGVATQADPDPLGCPRAEAERRIAAARRSGDRRAEASSLADLGIIDVNEGHTLRGLARLGDALAIAHQVGDRAQEGDILGNLGRTVLTAGEAARAGEIFRQELATARLAGDPFAEKLALEHLGLALSATHDPARALDAFAQALSLARRVGDRHHEPALLWQMAVQLADLGRRDQALSTAAEAVALFAKVEASRATLYAEHLQAYRSGKAEFAGPIPGTDAPAPSGPTAAPGPLRMAVTAARSLTKFLVARAKIVDPATLHRRLQVCATCEHHTGLRCRVCGCFTNVKARMPHEACPIGKWGG